MSTVPKQTVLQRLKSWVGWFAKLEELFVSDPYDTIKRMSALELEIHALKACMPELHPRRTHPDNLI